MKLRAWVTDFAVNQFRVFCRTVVYKGIKYPKYKQLLRHMGILILAMDSCGVDWNKIKCAVKKEAVLDGFCGSIVSIIRKTRYSVAQAVRTVMIREYSSFHHS